MAKWKVEAVCVSHLYYEYDDETNTMTKDDVMDKVAETVDGGAFEEDIAEASWDIVDTEKEID